MNAVAGLRGTGDWGTDERPKNFREMIMWMNPNGVAPMTALLSRVKKKSVDDAEFSWWAEPNNLFRVRIDFAANYGTTETLLTVDGTDPAAGTLSADYGSALHLVPGDLLLVEPTADAATYTHEIVQVTAVHSATQLSVKRAAAGTSAAAINDNVFLLKIGNAFAEGTDAPQSASRNPIKYNNLTQIFKTTYEVTGTASETNLRTGDPLANERKRKSMDHARDMELAFLFGKKSETTGDNGKPLRTTDGVRNLVGNVTILSNGWHVANVPGNSLIDAVSPVFNYDSEAGNERICFIGNGTLNRINEAVSDGANLGATQIRWDAPVRQWGMELQTLRFPQGTIYVKTHPLMNLHSLYNYGMFVLDFSALTYRPIRNRDTKFMDNIQEKGEDLIRGQWIGEAGLEMHHGGLTCAYIGGFNATLA